jgi:hypothetical protein
MLQEFAVEVGSDSKDNLAGAGSGGVEQQVDETDGIVPGLLGLECGMAQGLRVKLLPLVDIEEEPIGALLVRCREKAADAAADRGILVAQKLYPVLDPFVGSEIGELGRGWVEQANQGVERLRARAQTKDGPGVPVGAAAQDRD